MFFLFVTGLTVFGQSVGDFRSNGDGTWTSPTSWQVFDGISWNAATTYPGQNGGTYAVSILAGHTISTPGINTQPMGTLTISGTLRLNGGNSIVDFFLTHLRFMLHLI
jgi:hypothetical protein